MKIFIKKILFAIFGIFLVGIGIAFNAQAMLGNDPVGILYDGIKVYFNLSDYQRGLISNIFNYSLIFILFFFSRVYINIGTFIYTIPYGFFVNIGVHIYKLIFTTTSFVNSIIASCMGCFFLYLGVSIFIVTNIGVSPFTAIVLLIRDKTKLDFKTSKIIFDISFVLTGVLLGGKFGIVTIFMTLTTGISIQYICKVIENSKFYKNFLKA